MPVQNGTLYPYAKYRQHFQQEHESPFIWKWTDITSQLYPPEHAKQQKAATLMLATTDTESAYQFIPDVSIAIRVLKPGRRTREHAHSWWHLFIVQAGRGSINFTKLESASPISQSDVILVPAWCMHSIENTDEQEDLVLMCLSNLPQQAELANLLARDPEGQIEQASLQSG